MCGILGLVAQTPVNQLLYDGLLVLQHRGQDAAGIVTAQGNTFHMHKGNGLVRDVFRTRNMRALLGNIGYWPCEVSHRRAPPNPQPRHNRSMLIRRSASCSGITAISPTRHNSTRSCFGRICATSIPIPTPKFCSMYWPMNLQTSTKNHQLDPAAIFEAVAGVHRRCRGAYAVVAMIAGYGLLAFRDPYGIRPLVFGCAETEHGMDIWWHPKVWRSTPWGLSWYVMLRRGRRFLSMRTAISIINNAPTNPSHNPCIFEFVYMARPDSVMDGISVYETRLNMGESLADKITVDDAASGYRCGHPDSGFQPSQRLAACQPPGSELS